MLFTVGVIRPVLVACLAVLAFLPSAAHASAQQLSMMMDDDLLLYRGDQVRDRQLLHRFVARERVADGRATGARAPWPARRAAARAAPDIVSTHQDIGVRAAQSSHSGVPHVLQLRFVSTRCSVQAALEPFAHVRQKVLLTDDEPRQRAFYESLGYTELREHGNGALRAFVRFEGLATAAAGQERGATSDSPAGPEPVHA